MKGLWELFLCMAVILFAVGPALGEPVGTQCKAFGRYAPPREVIGEVTKAAVDSLGFRSIIVQDRNSGCRVRVMTNEQACVPGKQFRGVGRIRSFSGEDHDATLDRYASDKPACE